ncbi:hypothetical protein SAMN06265380_11275 [Ruegeria faecimaris]|uniref:Uncharacterized protein n=1 Tax=Ruegeria faecimaris TaxID=686389 RepID=A0A521EN52_9RHOB|nr:hypothetical protein SAMN06265380_11275 [Ruegeria faecimaris]
MRYLPVETGGKPLQVTDQPGMLGVETTTRNRKSSWSLSPLLRHCNESAVLNQASKTTRQWPLWRYQLHRSDVSAAHASKFCVSNSRTCTSPLCPAMRT